MTKWMLAALFLVGVASAQEGKQETKDDPKALLAKSIEESSKAGGFKVEGQVDLDSGMGGVTIGGFNPGGIEGKLTGVVGADGTVALKVETKKGIYEYYKHGGKIVQRQTWTGKQVVVGEFPREIAAILDLPHILKQIRKSAELKADGKKTVGDAECDKVKTPLKPDFLESDDDGSGMSIFELKKVDAAIHVAASDSLIRQIDVTFTRGLSSMVRMGAGGGGGDEEDGEEDEDGGPMGQVKATATYTIKLSGYDKALKAEVPADVKKLLEY